MTEKQFEQRILEIKARILPVFTSYNVPVRKGANGGGLKNSFTYEPNNKGFEITTDLFYMPYTNEPWVSPRWRGRQNPNLYWFNDSTEYIAQYMARHLGGKYVRTK